MISSILACLILTIFFANTVDAKSTPALQLPYIHHMSKKSISISLMNNFQSIFTHTTYKSLSGIFTNGSDYSSPELAMVISALDYEQVC